MDVEDRHATVTEGQAKEPGPGRSRDLRRRSRQISDGAPASRRRVRVGVSMPYKLMCAEACALRHLEFEKEKPRKTIGAFACAINYRQQFPGDA